MIKERAFNVSQEHAIWVEISMFFERLIERKPVNKNVVAIAAYALFGPFCNIRREGRNK
jgi:hypothetical protein